MNRKERRIAEAQGKNTVPPNLLGTAIALHQSGRLHEAEEIYKSLLITYPKNAEILGLIGALKLQQGDLLGAQNFLKQSITINSTNANTCHNYGYLLDLQKQYSEALIYFNKAIALNPQNSAGYQSAGNALNSLGRYSEAMDRFNKAIAINSQYVQAYNSLTYSLIHLRRFAEALDVCNKALSISPNYYETYFNRGTIFANMQRHHEAKENYNKAISLKPEYADAYFNKSYSDLIQGNYENGWKLYEWRWKKPEMQAEIRAFEKPQWFGAEPVSGKVILVQAEQGLGDTLQFCRYIPQLVERGAHVILEAPESLHGVLHTVEPSIQLVSSSDPIPRFDLRCPIMSLPLAFGTTLETIPSKPYLSAQSIFIDKWRPILDEMLGKSAFRVGLCWAGGKRLGHRNLEDVDARRSVHFNQLKPLFDVSGVAFVSLQLGGPEQELNDARVKDISFGLKNWSDTAAVVSLLDLVITVDTSVCHLAAGMGKRTFMLNRYDTCWRWLLDRDDSPWYPSLTQFRQEKSGDWENVIERVKSALIVISTNN